MKLKRDKTYPPSVTVQIREAQYQPDTQKHKMTFCRSITLREADPEKVYQLVLKTLERAESRQ